MLGLVAAEKTGGLNLGGGASGKLFVEADNTLHTEGIGGSAKCLYIQFRQYSHSKNSKSFSPKISPFNPTTMSTIGQFLQLERMPWGVLMDTDCASGFGAPDRLVIRTVGEAIYTNICRLVTSSYAKW